MSKLKVQVSLDIFNSPVANKVKNGKIIVAAVVTQALKLPHLPDPLLTITDAQSNLDFTAQQAESGDHAAVAAMHTSEKVWDPLFRRLAGYVNTVADGNKEFILLMGFDATAAESVPLAATEILKGFYADSSKTIGNVDIISAPQHLSESFLFTLTPPEAVISQYGNTIIVTIGLKKIYIVPNTHHNTVVTGLPSGEELSVYGAAFNNKGTGPVTKTTENVKPK